MNKESAKKLFAVALADSLSGEQLASFEAALERDPELCREFEAYADSNSGQLIEINNWLEVAADQRPLPTIKAHETSEKRGRLIPLMAGIASLAAAAAIAVVMMLPPDRIPAENGSDHVADGNAKTASWPTVASEEVELLEDTVVFVESWEGKEIAPGVRLDIAADTHVMRRKFGMYLYSGTVKVTLDEGAKYLIRSGDVVLSAKGPAEFTISSEVELHPEVLSMKKEFDPMFRHRSMLRLGAAGLVIGLSVLAGDVSAAQGNTTSHYAAGSNATIQAAPANPQAGPPKASDVFDHLDANSDGKLDNTEVDPKMITKMDDDSSGDIDLTEFTTHFKPGMHGPKGPGPNPFDAFKALDANSDGVLDSTEIGATELANWDADSSGDVDLAEFLTAHGHPTIKDIFDNHDGNADGYLDSNEIPQVVIDKWDGDSDNLLDETEFTSNFDPKTIAAGGAFQGADANSDGVIDSNEAPAKAITNMDTDSSGDIDFDEFLAKFKPGPHGPNPVDAFAHLDTNADGKLDSSEVPAQMIAQMDDDSSGDIDLAEFKAHFPKGGPGGPKGPGGPPTPADMFDHLDANSDGVLDSNEVPAQMIAQMDDDSSGDIDLTEFKKHHKAGKGGPGPGKGGPPPGKGPGGNPPAPPKGGKGGPPPGPPPGKGPGGNPPAPPRGGKGGPPPGPPPGRGPGGRGPGGRR